MKPFVALYKAYRGGEWLEHSLESVCSQTDGAVVVLSHTAWVDGISEPGNCREPLTRFMAMHPEYRIEVCEAPPGIQSDTQYKIGLETICKRFGPDSAVLVVDTDEAWEDASLTSLRKIVDSNSRCHYFRSGLYSYVRSPLYQVWPLEYAHACVALQNALPQNTYNRFAVNSPHTMTLPDIRFHHLTYVRENEDELLRKFATTSSQEKIPSDQTWWTRVWPNLPNGTNLHMTPGFEHCWEQIKVLPSIPIKQPGFCSEIIVGENERWKCRVEQEPTSSAIVPTPNDHDAKKYPEFAALASDVSLLRKRLKVTYLEALLIHQFAAGKSNILEIGSGTGGSLALMALGAPEANLVAVDPFCPYDETTATGTIRGVMEGNEAQFWETAKCYGYGGMVHHIKKNSHDAVADLPDKPFDLIFVDGNHSYEIVRRDLDLYWSRLAPYGTMLIHDYTTRFPGVIQACREWGVPYSVCSGTSLAYAQKEAT